YFACSVKKQGISVGWADVYSQSLPDQWIDVTDVAPGRYWLEVVADPDNQIVESNEENNTTRIAINLKELTRPRNDDFADRIALKGRAVLTHGNNTGAGKEIGEPDYANVSGGPSIWWSWTAPAGGKVVISTAGSRF